MENYWAYSANWFETTKKEVLKLKKHGVFRKEEFQNNLKKIKQQFCMSAIDYTVREVPEKRNKWDNAVLLCILKKDGTMLAKRHHNSQYIHLDY